MWCLTVRVVVALLGGRVGYGRLRFGHLTFVNSMWGRLWPGVVPAPSVAGWAGLLQGTWQVTSRIFEARAPKAGTTRRVQGRAA